MHGEGSFHFTPVHLQEALCILPSQNVWAILPMNGGAASARDVADDLVPGHWVAATRDSGKQAFQAYNLDSIRGRSRSLRRDGGFEDIGGLHGFRELPDYFVDRKVTAPQRDEHFLGKLES